MTKKKATKRYKALVNLSNDATGKNYQAGDPVTVDDFSADVLAHWLKTGRIEEAS